MREIRLRDCLKSPGCHSERRLPAAVGGKMPSLQIQVGVRSRFFRNPLRSGRRKISFFFGRNLLAALTFVGATVCGASADGGDTALIVAGSEGLWRVEGETLEVGERIDGGSFSAIAFGPEGDLFVQSGSQVREYDGSSYAFRSVFLDSPELEAAGAMAFGRNGVLFVARENQIIGFERGNPSPVSVEVFPNVAVVSGLTTSRDGQLLFSDAATGQVFRFDPVTGVTELHFDRLGAPAHIAVADEEWVVADNGERPALVRVSGQDRRLLGFFEEDLPEGLQVAGFRGAAIADGTVYTVETASGAIVRFPEGDGRKASVLAASGWGEAQDLAVAPLAPRPLLTYEAWREEQFSEAERLDPGISGPNADPVGDGIENALRFAFGGEREPLPRERLPRQEVLALEETQIVEIRFIRGRRLAIDRFRVEVASDLGNWEDNPERFSVVSVENRGDLEAVTVRDLKPLHGEAKRFYRLSVALPIEE